MYHSGSDASARVAADVAKACRITAASYNFSNYDGPASDDLYTIIGKVIDLWIIWIKQYAL